MTQLPPITPNLPKMTDYQFLQVLVLTCKNTINSDIPIEAKVTCNVILAYIEKHLNETRITRNDPSFN